MKTLDRSQVCTIKMLTNPPKEIVNCGMKVINTDGHIYEFIGLVWLKGTKAEREDYLEIPQLSD